MKKLLIIGVIALFIGLAFIPSFNAVSMYKKDNHPPSKPIINGPNGGKPGISYTFNFNAVDPDGDNVSYFIKWGDGTTYGWTPYTWSGINVPIAHTWDYICDCPIRVKAKDIYGKEGEWSDLIIRINRNKPQIIDIESTDDCGCSDDFSNIDEIKENSIIFNEVKSNIPNGRYRYPIICVYLISVQTSWIGIGVASVYLKFFCEMNHLYKLAEKFENMTEVASSKVDYYESLLDIYDC